MLSVVNNIMCVDQDRNKNLTTGGISIGGLKVANYKLVPHTSTWVGSALTSNTLLNFAVSGNTYLVNSSGAPNGVYVTLPEVNNSAVGLGYTFISSANSNYPIRISPHANDKIVGLNLSTANDKDVILNTPVEGDCLRIVSDGLNGWYISQGAGTWSAQA